MKTSTLSRLYCLLPLSPSKWPRLASGHGTAPAGGWAKPWPHDSSLTRHFRSRILDCMLIQKVVSLSCLPCHSKIIPLVYMLSLTADNIYKYIYNEII